MKATDVSRWDSLDRIIDRIGAADALSEDLWADIMAGAAVRLAAMPRQAAVSRLNRFAASGAWVDAAFVLIEVELAAWRLRRIDYDDGEWRCALSRAPDLPEWLDHAVEASHRDLALALVMVAIDTMREVRSHHEQRSVSVPQTRAGDRNYVCCDNF
ncbi:MAG: hypothetical protein P4M07_22935 [Xanthobacteraceae bacterium]|nr:hypothetical protein [Xanthobacteraceae bacterium]